VDGVEAKKMSRRFTGVTDINDRKIYTGSTVKMHYFFVNGSPSGNSVWEDEAEVTGKVGRDWRGIYIKTKEGIKYYWKDYLQDPEAELELLWGEQK
jgi:hypothetical protein